MIARVAVAAAIYAIDKPYSYLVPDRLTIAPGMRVQLPFGAGNRRTEGIVLAVEPGDDSDLKQIDAVLDGEPVLSEGMLRLAAFLRERYFCTFYDAAHAMLPAGLWFRQKDILHLAEPLPQDWAQRIRRKPQAVPFMEGMLAMGGSVSEQSLRAMLPAELPFGEILNYLIGKGLVTCDRQLLKQARMRTDTFIRLEAPVQEVSEYMASHPRNAHLQVAVLELLCAMGSACAKDVCYYTGATMATLRRLETLGYLSFFTCEHPYTPPPVTREDPPQLNEEQTAAFTGISAQMAQQVPGVALLYGVTGSGKTAVYLKLIRHALEQGRQAMLLVPEIALTPQLLAAVTAQFGEQTAILHSALPMAQRYEEWMRIRRGKARVVVGTRSAVFAPIQNLGLLIVDEEHEHTYKSEQTPYYHAREVAIYRGDREKALVVLGSATPSVESMYRAKSGQYSLYRLTKRYHGTALPNVVLTDMKAELSAGNGTGISRFLMDAMQKANARGEKTILFLNRRGNSRMAACVNCGYVPQCPRCSVSLTYHSANNRAMCHYCGYSQPAEGSCPACGTKMKLIGLGTQRVQETLQTYAPALSVLRMDADTVSAANSHEKILKRFETGEASVLLGTQMVTKGLNFPAVTLVGVLDADAALYMDHFRASETAFSMLTQVIGRAGRFQKPGTAIVQTMTPNNATLQCAARQDYDSFYETEIALRQLRRCPPFCDLITLTLTGLEERQVADCAAALRDSLVSGIAQMRLPVGVLGPAPAPVARVNRRFRYRLTLSGKADRTLRGFVAGYLREFAKNKKNRGVYVLADINSYD